MPSRSIHVVANGSISFFWWWWWGYACSMQKFWGQGLNPMAVTMWQCQIFNVLNHYFLFFFLGLHPRPMEFLGQGLNWSYSCQPTPQPQQHGTYTTAHGNAGSLTHWTRPGVEPTSSWILVGFVSAAPQRELLDFLLFSDWMIFVCVCVCVCVFSSSISRHGLFPCLGYCEWCCRVYVCRYLFEILILSFLDIYPKWEFWIIW